MKKPEKREWAARLENESPGHQVTGSGILAGQCVTVYFFSLRSSVSRFSVPHFQSLRAGLYFENSLPPVREKYLRLEDKNRFDLTVILTGGITLPLGILACKAVITIAIRLRYDYDTTIPRRIQLRRK